MKVSTKFEVSETAKIFKVEISILKIWARTFSEYLSSEANPKKGHSRKFSIPDIRVFAYINMYWEESPDIENIEAGLNSNNHYDNEPIDHLITELTPLFQEFPNEIDENWRGIIFGGEFSLEEDLFETANSYKLAGDILVDNSFDSYEERKLFQPAIFNYRHSVELYIKSVTGEEITHDLSKLYRKLKVYLKDEFNAVPTNWFDKIIEAFDYSDPTGTTFRYGGSVPNEELYADMRHIKNLMHRFSNVFHKIRYMKLDKATNSYSPQSLSKTLNQIQK